ncbi:hypothetical protein OAM23_00680 [Luminiphilus sp.]|nr:hypothetical protein [Luminiphilus sp.]
MLFGERLRCIYRNSGEESPQTETGQKHTTGPVLGKSSEELGKYDLAFPNHQKRSRSHRGAEAETRAFIDKTGSPAYTSNVLTTPRADILISL